MSCCMHVCVNVGPLPAVRRDVVDDDVVRSCRARHRRAPALRVRETELLRHAPATPAGRTAFLSPLRWTARGDRDITDD